MKNSDTNGGVSSRPRKKATRLYYLDWLRVIGTLLIFAFHSAAPFHPWFDWHIRSVQKSEFLGWVNTAFYSWPMPLFMLLAGAGTWFALGRRTNRQFVGERVMRLFLPLLIGVIILIPPQVYLERVQRWQFRGSFLEFLPHAFEGGPYPEGNLSLGQLWFLLYLFLYALAMLPLFRFLRGDTGRRWVSGLAALSERRGGILILALPLIVGQIALGWRFPETHNLVSDWMWHWQLLSAFVLGYILYSDARFEAAIARDWPLALVLALASSAGMLLLFGSGRGYAFDLVFGFGSPRLLRLTRYQLLYALGSTLFRLNTWTFLILVLGLAQKYLRASSRFLMYASRASGTVYLLHQTVIILVAFYVVQWRIAILPKFLIILTVSLAITMALYEIIRRWSVTRFMFGLKGGGRRPASG
ncbi:MAG: acyltransferase family protein [Anaerolineae bacterium]